MKHGAFAGTCLNIIARLSNVISIASGMDMGDAAPPPVPHLPALRCVDIAIVYI